MKMIVKRNDIISHNCESIVNSDNGVLWADKQGLIHVTSKGNLVGRFVHWSSGASRGRLEQAIQETMTLIKDKVGKELTGTSEKFNHSFKVIESYDVDYTIRDEEFTKDGKFDKFIKEHQLYHKIVPANNVEGQDCDAIPPSIFSSQGYTYKANIEYKISWGSAAAMITHLFPPDSKTYTIAKDAAEICKAKGHEIFNIYVPEERDQADG